MRRVLAALVLTLVISGTAAAVDAWRTATVYLPAEATLRTLIANEHYRVCGRALGWDSQLIWTARWKVTDMGLRGYFAHGSTDGFRVWQGYARTGIPYTYAAEILALNYNSDDTAATAAFKAFMASSSHRAVIRSCTYTRFGVGAYKAKTRHLFAVEFTRP